MSNLPENVIPFSRGPKTFGPAEMSLWFQKLGRRLVNTSFVPTAFVVVLINEEDQRLYRYGPSSHVDEAIRYAKDDADYREKGHRFPGLYRPPAERRAEHRAFRQQQETEQAAYAAEYPWVCEACAQRFRTQGDYDTHQAVGHRCWRCHAVLKTIDHWESHHCEGEERHSQGQGCQLRVAPR